MSKIGIIWVGFNTEEYVEASLRPWIEARRNTVEHQFVICAVNVPFKDFPSEQPDTTRHILRRLAEERAIDWLITHDEPIKETEARGSALKWLVGQECEIVMQVDSDEFYTTDEIARILSFVEARPHIAAFRGSLKNYVEPNGERIYLVEPFTPMRIHRVRHGTYVADSFWADNNVLYRGTITRDFRRDEDLPTSQIPKAVAWVRHESWPNSKRSRRKIEYQLKGRGWPQCSFAWDDSKGGLIFNPALPAPEVAHD